MGPRLISVEDAILCLNETSSRPASMGPRLISVEDGSHSNFWAGMQFGCLFRAVANLPLARTLSNKIQIVSPSIAFS